MSIVRVAIPVLKGKHRFSLLKGRPWSAAEHLILQSLVATPRTVRELSDASDLPRRVIIEMLIRLMRVGWIEVSLQPEGTVFRATEVGMARSGHDDLPAAMRSMRRWMAFFVDRVTSTVYRGREFQAYSKKRLQERGRHETIVWLKPDDTAREVDPITLFGGLADEDERIVSFEPSNERLSELYALVTVRNGHVEGLPTRAPPSLQNAIVAAAASAKVPADEPAGADGKDFEFKIAAPEDAPKIVDSVFSINDLVLGGDAHLDTFKTAIRCARTRVIVHSTFISEEGIQTFLPLFRDAARRGVRVDVLWGQGNDTGEFAATSDRVRQVREQMKSESLDGLVVFHQFSTQSHAKIIVADDLAGGEFSAIVGSCNWLSSGFWSFEASLRVREPKLVGQVLNVLAKMSIGGDGHWAPLTTDLARLAVFAEQRPTPKGHKVPAAIVLGAHHGSFVREARDSAQRRIFVASHRLSEVGNRAVVLPAIAAAQDGRGVSSRLFFNRVSGQLTQSAASELILSSGRDNVKLTAVHDPRLHAKILAWDDDSIVITSQNWLSVDASPHQPLQEVGVYIGGGRAADHVIRTFDVAHIA